MSQRFERRKQEAEVDAKMERDGRKAWREKHGSIEEQQRIKEERYRQMGDGAFAHHYGKHPPLRDDDKYDDDEYDN